MNYPRQKFFSFSVGVLPRAKEPIRRMFFLHCAYTLISMNILNILSYYKLRAEIKEAEYAPDVGVSLI
jgi:hypothetical protein